MRRKSRVAVGHDRIVQVLKASRAQGKPESKSGSHMFSSRQRTYVNGV